MIQRGRKSEESLKLAEMAPKIARPDPADGLTEAQAVVWRRIVGCEAEGWFKASQLGLLANYCRLEVWSNELASAVDAKERREFIAISHEMASVARALRLTNQSRYYPEQAGRKAAAAQSRPWGVPAAG